MSYILEALKKSEQARLASAATPAYSLHPVVLEESAPRPLWPHTLAVAALVGAATLYVWPRLQAAPPAPAAVVIPPTPAPERGLTEVSAPRPAADAGTRAKAAAQSENRGLPPPPAPALAPSRPAAAELPAPIPSVAPAPQPAPARRAAAIEAPEAGAEGAATAPRRKAAAAPRDTPAPMPRALPALSVSGYIRGDGSPGTAIVNGTLLSEGDEVLPGLKLEEVLDDGVIFSYEGQRFRR